VAFPVRFVLRSFGCTFFALGPSVAAGKHYRYLRFFIAPLSEAVQRPPPERFER
jgi:hypothetical protein